MKERHANWKVGKTITRKVFQFKGREQRERKEYQLNRREEESNKGILIER